ncbi:MAG: hypothetical protein AAGB23_11435 [Pseudomonadota bacterium]
MISLAIKSLSVVATILALAALAIWIVGSQQPSRGIHANEKVLVVALKRDAPTGDLSEMGLSSSAIWKAQSLFPLIGAESYWTDFLILPPDRAALVEIETTPGLLDSYVAEVQLLDVPTLALGLLRTQHLLGITRRPSGPVPTSFDGFEGRADVLPNTASIQSLHRVAPGTSLTMMNFLKYFAVSEGDETDGREAYGRYGQEAFKAVHAVGGQLLFAGRVTDVVIASKGQRAPQEWDDLAAMIYPDPTAILSMEQNPAYRKSLGERDAGLKRIEVYASAAY